MKLLAHLELTYEAIASYWITEAENLESQCNEPEESGEAADVTAQGNKHVTDKITTWRKAKEEIDDYVKRLSKVSNSFNFQTEAKPPKAQSVEYEKLDFTLRVPTTINLQENGIPTKIAESKVRLSVSE